MAKDAKILMVSPDLFRGAVQVFWTLSMEVVPFPALDPLGRCGTCDMEEMYHGLCDFRLGLSCSLLLQYHPRSFTHSSPAKEETGSDTCPMLGRCWGFALC